MVKISALLVVNGEKHLVHLPKPLFINVSIFLIQVNIHKTERHLRGNLAKQSWILRPVLLTRSLNSPLSCLASSWSRKAILFLILEEVQMTLPRSMARTYSTRTLLCTSPTRICHGNNELSNHAKPNHWSRVMELWSRSNFSCTWYGGGSILRNFLKFCLILASIASKATVLFSHFLFTSLSKKGWKDKEKRHT